MNKNEFIAGSCDKCGASLEFPQDLVGTVECPHCGEQTSVPRRQNPLTSKWFLGGIVGGLVLVGVIFSIKLNKATRKAAATPNGAAITTTTNVVSSEKSATDLKVSAIKLEKLPGSSLVYATGTMKNDSKHQRFAVTIELKMLDASGATLGTTRDYIAILEPEQSWDFRAIVTDAKTVSASISRVEEEK